MPYLWLFAPLIVFYDGLSLLNSVLTQRNLSAWRGRLDGWRQAGSALRKRRAMQAATRVPAAEIFRLLAPAATPWEVQRRYQHLARPDKGPRPGA